MAHSFVAYIDESGDDGIGNYREPGADGGMSRWLIISACVLRQSHDINIINWRGEISGKMPEKKSREIHFSHMNHRQKLVTAQILAEKEIRAISVISSKETIPDGTYSDKNQLYFYLTRYLVERISWFCRDMRSQVPEGDGRVKITFSRRGGMSYEHFRAYLHRLQEQETHIEWPVIDIDGIDAKDHSTRAGLQIVDSVASAFASGFEPDKHGNCESRYAEILKPIVYNYKGNYLSYGVKVVPRPKEIPLTPEQLRMIKIFQ